MFPHDVWVIAPGWQRPPSATQVTTGLKFPGDPSVSKTFTETGTWTFLCKIHSVLTAGPARAWSARPTVTAAPAGDAPSGVDYTEYRVKTGATQGDWVKTANTGGGEPVRLAGHDLGRGPAHGRVPLGRQGRQRRGDQDGVLRHRHPGPGLPGHRGVRRPDLGHGAAAGPVLRHRVRPRRWRADLQAGSSPTAPTSAARSSAPTPSRARTRPRSRRPTTRATRPPRRSRSP